uniref:J domain-containing protein n=1 Tax=Vitrella brassicaformis TaxID=1169539 RepID=A0A7S1P2K8_9ALVE
MAASIACGSVDCHYGLTSSLAEALVPLTKEEKIDKIEQAMAKLREEWMKAMERAKQIADEIFCVHPDASFDEVRRKYRVLAKIYHPDRGGDTQRFQEIGMAYEVLQNYKTNNPARVLASMASVLAVADGQEGVGEE